MTDAPRDIEQPAPRLTELYRSPRYVVRSLHCNDEPFAVICFEYWYPAPSLDREFAAEGFFRDRRINAIGILAAENDWFQHPDIAGVLEAIRAATTGFDLIGYGGSMGAYGAINFADALGLRTTVAVCPQYSIDSALAPYETRWRAEAARIAATCGFGYDRIAQVRPPQTGWLIYDPGSVDLLHARAIQASHLFAEIPIRFARHQEMRVLQQAGMFTPMLLDMLAGRFDPVAFRRAYRSARRQSAAFWLGLADILARRGALPGALRAIRFARALPHPEPAAFDLQEAGVLGALGRVSEARALAGPWIDHPGWGSDAASLLAGLPASSAPARKPSRGARLLAYLRHRRFP